MADPSCPGGGTGRRAGFRYQWSNSWRFESSPGHHRTRADSTNPVIDRKYDLVLYGASGFTGRQTVAYCKQFAPAGLSWAIAGRNRSKLDSVNLAGADVLVADAQDDNALDNLARQTRVVASTAGPFGLYGTKLLAACVRNRTHYCDITGETPWIRQQK